MKAIRVHAFGGPEVLKLEEVPAPKPAAGQVLVRVKAAGVNPVETYVRSGQYAMKPPLPYTPGSDAGGVVEAVGPGVTSCAPGDRVYTARSLSGTYAELALCSEEQVHRLAERASFEEGAAMGVAYATAYRGLVQRAGAVAGDAVLVHGASGGVGTAAVQLARLLGMNAFGTAGTKEGCDLVLEEGARRCFNHKEPGYLDAAVEATPGGEGFDVILEMLANVNLGKDLPALRKGGRVVVIGSRGPVEIDARNAMGRDASILGMSLPQAAPRELASIYAFLSAALEAGTIKPVIGKKLPLAQAAQAHEAVMAPGARGKIVLLP